MTDAAASNSAVGLYIIDHLTPEAVEQGESLIRPSAKHYVIDDAELQRVKNNYPCIWKEPGKDPQLCFLGCPHFSEMEILDWLSRVDKKLTNNRRKKVTVPTVFTAAPDVIDAFQKNHPERAKKLKKIGIILSPICPLSYTGNPFSVNVRIITCSNKLRTYSHARFYSEDELLDIITGGEKK